ncbi:MAG: TonB-dependent receptor [Steroidobacteraceae bacterium]
MPTQHGSRFIMVLLAGIASLAALPRPAAAAAAEATASAGTTTTLEEVVVTADKRGEESLESIPTAIQAITGEALERKGVVEFADFAGQVAGLSYGDLGPGDKKYVIRGVTSVGPSTVGVYYDEAVITGANANDGAGREPDIRTFDLDRIEVLKGPQGTLYGASSMSGTIRYITRKPVLDKVEGYVQGEGSDTSQGGGNFMFNGALNLPIVPDALALRVVGWDIQNSGFIDDIRIPAGAIDDANWEKTQGGRAELRWKASDALDIVASATVQTTHTGGSARYTPPGALSFPPPAEAVPGFPQIPGGDLKNTDLTVSPWNENLQVFGVTATYTMSNGVVTATSNYFNRHVDFVFDSTPILFFFGVPIPGITLQPQNRAIASNELRYASKFSGPINFVVGAFSQHERNDFLVQVVKSNAFGNAAGPFNPDNSDDALSNPNGNTFFGRTDDNRIKQYAGFGELDADFTDKLSGLVGVRYFHSEQDSVQNQTHPFGGFTSSPVGPQTNTESDGKTTFKLNLSYKADFGLMYATASEGFRVGGTNAADLPFASNIPRTFGPDQLRNYEVGLKTDFLDKRVRLNMAAYAIRWSDIQIQSTDTTGAFVFTTNAGTASVDGFELESQMLLTTGLEFDLAATYENARLTADQPNPRGLATNPGQCPVPGVNCVSNIAVDGDHLPEVPKVMLNGALTYTVPLSAAATGSLRADLTYRSNTDSQANTLSQYNVPLGAYVLVGLRASIDWNDWNVALFGKNITNKRAQIDAIRSDQDPLALITVRPRTIGLQVTRKF